MERGFSWIYVIIIMIVLFMVSSFVLKGSFNIFSPLDAAITNETIKIEKRINNFDQDYFTRFPFLFFVQVETYSSWKNVKPKIELVDVTDLKPKENEKLFVYKSFSLTFTHDNDEDMHFGSIKTVLINFKVNKEEMKKKDAVFDKQDIRLYSWQDKKWNKNDVIYIKEEDNHYFYEVSVPYDGLFAIVGVK